VVAASELVQVVSIVQVLVALTILGADQVIADPWFLSLVRAG